MTLIPLRNELYVAVVFVLLVYASKGYHWLQDVPNLCAFVDKHTEPLIYRHTLLFCMGNVASIYEISARFLENLASFGRV